MFQNAPNQTVLIVDGDPIVRRYVHNILHEEGLTVLEAADQKEALEVASRAGRTIDLLISELHLANGRASDLARHMQPLNPHMKTLVMSSLYRRILRHVDTPKRFWLTKPFSPTRLQRRVRRMLGNGYRDRCSASLSRPSK